MGEMVALGKEVAETAKETKRYAYHAAVAAGSTSRSLARIEELLVKKWEEVGTEAEDTGQEVPIRDEREADEKSEEEGSGEGKSDEKSGGEKSGEEKSGEKTAEVEMGEADESGVDGSSSEEESDTEEEDAE
jgi:hypothetical protein